MNSKWLKVGGAFVVFICIGIAITTTFHAVYWSIVFAKKEKYTLADFQVQNVRSERNQRRSGFWRSWVLEGVVDGKSEIFRIPLNASEYEPYQRGDVVQIYHDPNGADIAIEDHHLRVIPIKEFDKVGEKLFLSLIGLSGSLVVGWPTLRLINGKPISPFKKSPNLRENPAAHSIGNRRLSNKKMRNRRRPDS